MNNAAISFGLVEFVLTGIVFCIFTVALTRRSERRVAWLWWIIALIGVVGVRLIWAGTAFSRSGDPISIVYVFVVTWCIPTALTVWASLRAVRGKPPGPVRHFARTYAVFVLASIVGMVLTA